GRRRLGARGGAGEGGVLSAPGRRRGDRPSPRQAADGNRLLAFARGKQAEAAHPPPERRPTDAESPRRLFAVAADLGEDLEDPPRLRGRLALRALAHLVRLEEFRWQVGAQQGGSLPHAAGRGARLLLPPAVPGPVLRL